MKNSKVFLVVLLMFMTFALIGCSSSEAKDLWNRYIEGITKENVQEVCDTFYESGSTEATNFIENTKEEGSTFETSSEYMSNVKVSSIKTKSFETEIKCDFSSEGNPQTYYKINVTAEIDGSSKEFPLYIYTNNKGAFFCSPIHFSDEDLGNKPNSIWLSQAYYETENGELLYSVVDDKYIKVLRNVGNEKEMEIPVSVDEVPVKLINSYAFYRFSKILCFTFPSSRLRSIVIPEGIETIGEYAFFQCTNLKEVKIPASVNKISAMAFTGCSGMKNLYLLRESTIITDKQELTSTSVGGGSKPLVIKGAYDIQEGEIITLSTLKYPDDENTSTIKWSTTSSNITINADTGEVYASETGQAIVKVQYRDNPQIYATVTINIEAVDSKVDISNDSFNRCSSLENIYISAYNPNTLKISGTGKSQLNLTSSVKIYVPKGTLKMYAQSKSWSAYADQLYEMN